MVFSCVMLLSVAQNQLLMWLLLAQLQQMTVLQLAAHIELVYSRQSSNAAAS
jgi:hypothetical protein